MLMGLGLLLAAVDMAFVGRFLPRLGLLAGIITATAGVGIYSVGRGAVIDGTRRKIHRWWGYIWQPLFWSEQDLSNYDALEITKKLGMKSGKASVGRRVWHPLWLVNKNGNRILLKRCGRIKESRALAKEISDLVNLPIQDKAGESSKTIYFDDSIERLLSSYQLQEKYTGFFGTWRETEIEGHRVAFKGYGGKLKIYVGDFDPDEEQITRVYLGRVSASQPLPGEDSGQRLDPIVGVEGSELARNYFLRATGGEYPELQFPEVRSALLSLSPCVYEVGLYDFLGVGVGLDLTDAAQSGIDSVVKQAVALLKALKNTDIYSHYKAPI
jgi:hypothetical protein